MIEFKHEQESVFVRKENRPEIYTSLTRLAMYIVLGQRVRNVVDDHLEAGVHTMSFDASLLASGVYFYKMDARASDGSQRFGDVKKLVLLK